MTLEHELLQLARDAILSLMSGRDFAVGQTGHYLNIISRIEAELSRPKPKQEFYPDWETLQPFYERIKELEEQLAKPEQSHYSDIVSDGSLDPRNKFDAQHVPQVCCGDYEKCWRACTPRGEWLAKKKLFKPEQEPVAWAVLRPDGRVKLLSHQIGVEVDLKWTPLYTKEKA